MDPGECPPDLVRIFLQNGIIESVAPISSGSYISFKVLLQVTFSHSPEFGKQCDHIVNSPKERPFFVEGFKISGKFY